MSFSQKIKNKLLDSSDRFNSINNENKKLKKINKKLKKSNQNLKLQLENNEKLLNVLFNIDQESGETPNFCPVCGYVGEFSAVGKPPRKNASCPNCRSLERVRFAKIVMNQRYSYIFKDSCKVLHFAPEKIFYKIFNENPNIDYYPVDIDPERYKKAGMTIRKQANMENIPFDDNYFDFIYNSHVLEHVPNDKKAMEELYRVLKPNGVIFIAVPLFNIPETYQNDEYNTPELRLKHYGQADHLRMYGNDFKDKLESAGFSIEALKIDDIFSDEVKGRIISCRGETLFVGMK